MTDAKSFWVADQEADACMRCGKAFSFFFRRHHCRKCGLVVCAPCSGQKFAVDGYARPVRVCRSCYDEYTLSITENRPSEDESSRDKKNTSMTASRSPSGQQHVLTIMADTANWIAAMKPSAIDYAQPNSRAHLKFAWPEKGSIMFKQAVFSYNISSLNGPEVNTSLAAYTEYELTWSQQTYNQDTVYEVHRSAGCTVSMQDPSIREERPAEEAVTFLVDKFGHYMHISSDMEPLTKLVQTQFRLQYGASSNPKSIEKMNTFVAETSRSSLQREMKHFWHTMVEAWLRFSNDASKVPSTNLVSSHLFGDNVWEVQQTILDDSKSLQEQVVDFIASSRADIHQPHFTCGEVSGTHWMSSILDHKTLTPYLVKTDDTLRLVLQTTSDPGIEYCASSLVSRTLSMGLFCFSSFPDLHVPGQAPQKLEWNQLLAAYIEECSDKYETHVAKVKELSQAIARTPNVLHVVEDGDLPDMEPLEQI